VTAQTPQAGDPVEVIPAVVDAQGLGGNFTGTAAGIRPMPVATSVAVTPTQVRRPWRSTARTVFQGAVGLASLVPLVAAGVYDNSADYPVVVVQAISVSGAVTRVMAIPQAEAWLRRFLPFLAAAPDPGKKA
jgi:hypothetical protein